MRCFIAMAFGRKETDKTYGKLIAPTLRHLKIAPVRVDRIEHLEDINNKIIVELNKCDLALADLTYARPSVYFEAGYAQRAVPVVYTCRADHLSGRADDQFGNFRVHFDLRMKNIIPWSSPNYAEFRRKLERRMKRAVLPIFLDKKMKDVQEASARKFAALSLHERIRRLIATSRSVLKLAGFASPSLIFYTRHQNGQFSYLVERVKARLDSLSPGFLVTRQANGTTRAMLLHVAPSLTQSLLTNLDLNLLPHPVYNLNPRGRLRLLVEHLIVCSFRQVPISRIQTCLPHFHLNRDSREFEWASRVDLPSKRIRGFDELYRSDYAADTFLGLSPYRQGKFEREQNYFVSEQQERRRVVHSYPARPILHRRVARVVSVNRHVHLRIFDNVKFERLFREEFYAWLKEAQKCN
jgi:nucleoside 2-deoxyribosyltransferase